MNYRRGSFLRSLEEDCEIRRERVQRRPTETEFEIVLALQKMIILNDSRRDSAAVSEIIELDNRYIANITPPNPLICIADQIVRPSGQILTVVKVTTILEIQQLQLEDRNMVVA